MQKRVVALGDIEVTDFIENYRKAAVDRVFQMAGFAACWPIWKVEIATRTQNLKSVDDVYELGANLRDIFFLTNQTGRSQAGLSGAGAGWEGLVCWYLNTILTGTRAVVVKQSRVLMPTPLLDAMSVNYGSKQTNTESDLSGIVFPDDPKLLNLDFGRPALNLYVAANLSRMQLHNIQCKTNWNDNAQIPMLWDMVYRAKGFKDTLVSIGKNGRSIADLANFTYSFVTVPTQSKPIKESSMAVKRVGALTGGNFWGIPSESGVAWSVSEMFKRVFGDDVVGDVRTHISGLIQNGLITLK